MTSMQILQTLLEITVYSAVLFACIMVFKTICKGKLSATLSFVLWFLLIARLCIPVTIQSAFHLFTMPKQQQQVTQQTAQQAPSATALQQSLASPEQIAAAPQVVPLQQQTVQQPSGEQIVKAAPQPTLPTLNVYDWIMLLWLCGACAFGGWTIGLSWRIAKVIRNQSVPAPAEIEKLYASCRLELGIKKRPPLLVTQNLLSPALVVSARPTILLPSDFIKHAPQEQIRLALCHELAHYKRRDYWLCILLRVLSIVYWFNPVLWLAEKEIVADMETACDNRIVRGMEIQEKAYYANTILSMFSARAETPFVLGLALPNTKRVAEKRIRGIYMKNKTKSNTKLSALLLAMVLVVSCFTTACQPFQAGSKYNETKKLNDIVTVKYDADIVQPSTVPQATLKVRDFTDEDLQKVADYFLPDRQLYAPWTPTKTELQAQIQSLQQRSNGLKAQKDAFIAQNSWAAELYQAYLDGYFEDNKQTDQIKTKYNMTARDIAAFKSACYDAGKNEWLLKYETTALETAPDTATKQPADVHFRFSVGYSSGPTEYNGVKIDGWSTGDGCSLWSENTDGSISQIDGMRQYGELYDWISYYRQIMPNPQYKPLAMPIDQAQKLAQQAVAAISPDLSLTTSSTGTYNYSFFFTRKVAGVPVAYDAYADYAYAYQKLGSKRMSYYETIQVTVDNQGVSRLEWQNPYTDIQITNPNAKVISVDEAKKKFEADILATLVNGKYADINYKTGKMDSIALDINKVELGLTRIQDDKGNFSLVPTWDFYGKATAIKDGQKQIFNRFGQDQDNESLGTVNALDGTEIQRSGLLQNW